MRDNRERHALRAAAEEAKALRQFKRALRIYDALCEQAPHDPLGHHRAGEILHRLGRTSEALVRLHQAADLYSSRGFSTKASAVYRIMLQLRPGQPDWVAALQALEAQRLDEEDGASRSAAPSAGSPFLPRPQPGLSASPTPAQPAAPPLEPESDLEATPHSQDQDLILDLSPAPHLDWEQDLVHGEGKAPATILEDSESLDRGETTGALIDEDDLVERLEAQLGGPHAVVMFAKGSVDLVSLGLTSDEMALFRSIDGHATCDQLLVASGMPRLVALSLLLRLRDAGVIFTLQLAPAAHAARA